MLERRALPSSYIPLVGSGDFESKPEIGSLGGASWCVLPSDYMPTLFQLPLSCCLATSSAAVAAAAQASACSRSRFAHQRPRWNCYWLQNAPANGGRGISAGGFLLAHLNDPTAAPAAMWSARARGWGPRGSWIAWAGEPGIRGECRHPPGTI